MPHLEGHFTVYLGNAEGVDPANRGWRDADHQPIDTPTADNPAPEGAYHHKGDRLEGKRRLEVTPPDGATVKEAFDDITRPGGCWDYWAADGSTPGWVSSDNDDIASLLANIYECEKRPFLPEGERGEHRNRPHVVNILGPVTGLILAIALLVMVGRFYLRTNAGTDWQSTIMGSAAGNPAKYMALTGDSAAAAAGDTTLASEITTASGGLIRAAATYAHTNGTSTYTLTKTFTANGSDSLPVTVKKIGVFDASSSGTMAFEKVITDTLFAASGDAATVTYTITP